MSAIVDDAWFKFKTKPFKHQFKEWKLSRSALIRAILWEQGTGKSKLVVDTLAWLWYTKEVNAMVVVAPNGVQRNWVTDEIPTHLPDDIPVRTHIYESKKAGAKYHQRALAQTKAFKGLAVLVISYNAFTTERGAAAVWEFLRDRECLYVLDESHRIKGSDGKGVRAERIVKSGNFCKYKRILTGTPISVGPFDLWMQISFLDPYFFKERSLASFLAFKHYFGIWRQGLRSVISKKDGKEKKVKFKFLVEYKNLGVLREMLGDISTRVRKADVLDLPPKVYSKRYFTMTKEQRRIYDAMKDEYMVEYNDGLITAPLSIVRLIRFQQIVSGFMGDDDGETVHEIIEGGNARLALLADTLEDVQGKVIIWAKYTHDIETIKEMLGDKAVTYHGQTDDLAESIARFRGVRITKDLNGQVTGREAVPEAEQATYFVANQGMGSEGLTLTEAETVIYYSNSYKFIDRLQSEDRCHRIGTTNAVNYIDIVAEDSIDEGIIDNLLRKNGISAEITGDQVKEWL